jgi:metal-sulfur cluster biosynthetic enzyme
LNLAHRIGAVTAPRRDARGSEVTAHIESPHGLGTLDQGLEDPDMIDQENLLSALRTVKDPELNVNVIDLGLVYAVQVHDDQVDVEMTLTTPACPAGPEMLRSAVTALEGVPGVTKANVRLVMSPPWTPDKMSDAARDELGFF